MAAKHDGDSPLARALARLGGRPAKVIDFPGLEGTRVALWCPNEAEESAADVQARQRLTSTFKLSALDLSLAQETALAKRERELELLALVLRDPADPEMAFVESSDELRESISGPQREALIAALADFKVERFEAHTPAEDAELARLVRDLGKADGVLDTWLTSCAADSLRRIVRALAASTPPTPDSSSTT